MRPRPGRTSTGSSKLPLSSPPGVRKRASRPSSTTSTRPLSMRGDREGLPVAELDGSADQAAAIAAIARFRDAATAHLLREERRLAYVAVTRARTLLLCTGYRWDTTQTPRDASVFLEAVQEICVAGNGAIDCWTEKPDDGTSNPVLASAPA